MSHTTTGWDQSNRIHSFSFSLLPELPTRIISEIVLDNVRPNLSTVYEGISLGQSLGHICTNRKMQIERGIFGINNNYYLTTKTAPVWGGKVDLNLIGRVGWFLK